jgi:hypothetical protein
MQKTGTFIARTNATPHFATEAFKPGMSILVRDPNMKRSPSSL